MRVSAEQLANAEIILSVGAQVGANSKQLLAAIEAALVESGLVNVRHGDRDSLGLFQQRPSQGWGTQSQVMDPYRAARSFFLGAGTNRGALEVSQAGTAGQLAQRVQRSAFPDRYDKRETDAKSILAQFGAESGGFNYESGGYENEKDGGPVPDSGYKPLLWIALTVVGILVVDTLVNE